MENFPIIGLWIPEDRISAYLIKGYEITNPQPALTVEMQRYHRGSTHMTKKVEV
jgi:hypothetical protein